MKGKKFFKWLGMMDRKAGYPWPSISRWNLKPAWTYHSYFEGYVMAIQQEGKSK